MTQNLVYENIDKPGGFAEQVGIYCYTTVDAYTNSLGVAVAVKRTQTYRNIFKFSITSKCASKLN